MKCFNPIKIRLEEDTRKKRIECEYMPLDWRFATFVYVPCGKCPACASRRRSEWSFRLFQEVKNAESCYFLTLTYDDEHLPFTYNEKYDVDVPTVKKRDVQLFLKRLRFNLRGAKIRYFVVSEYGPKFYRPHYHMLLFNFPLILKNKLDDYIRDAWQNGFVRVDPVSDGRVNYVTSYCLDSSFLPPFLNRNFMLCSRRPALGASYLDNDSVVKYHLDNMDDFGYIPTSGKVKKVRLPRYYRDRILSDEQRNKISLKSREYYDNERKSLLAKQKQWLKSHGVEVNSDTIKIPYPSSPLELDLQRMQEFKRKVENKCKMKKNG